MAAPEHTDEENEHLRALLRKMLPKYGSANKLAMALEMQGSSLGQILERGGGVSKATARRLAELAEISYDEAVGRASGRKRMNTPAQSGGPFRATADAAKKARVLLREPGQPRFSDEAIAIAEEDTLFSSQSDASRPSAVAEAWRHTILGSAASMPLHPAPPSVVPPEGTRRSRMHVK